MRLLSIQCGSAIVRIENKISIHSLKEARNIKLVFLADEAESKRSHKLFCHKLLVHVRSQQVSLAYLIRTPILLESLYSKLVMKLECGEPHDDASCAFLHESADLR